MTTEKWQLKGDYFENCNCHVTVPFGWITGRYRQDARAKDLAVAVLEVIAFQLPFLSSHVTFLKSKSVGPVRDGGQAECIQSHDWCQTTSVAASGLL